jgi:hypothetical protein
VNILAGSGLVVLALLLSTAFPLFTYTTTLAIFGLAHVAVEMRYVESRFAERLLGPLLTGVAALLVLVVGVRIIHLTGWVNSSSLILVELSSVGLISASVLFRWGRQSGLAGTVSAVVAGAVAVGTFVSPVSTMLLLACLHNWTPVGFIAEATRGRERLRWMTLSVVVLVGLPLLIASGLVHVVLDPWTAVDFTLLSTEPLQQHLGAFLPAALHPYDWAPRLFSAVVFAQCMHYLAVLGILPRYADHSTRRWLTAIPRPVYGAGIALGTLGLLVLYTHDFDNGRRLYGIAASIHAWIELPVLMLALRPPMEEQAA